MKPTRVGNVLLMQVLAAVCAVLLFSSDSSNVTETRGTIERFTADQQTLQRSDSTPLSPQVRERMRAFYNEAQAQLNAASFDSMTQEGKIDYLLLRNQLTHELHSLDQQAAEVSETEPLVPFAPAIVKLAEDLRWRHFLTGKAAAANLTWIGAAIDQAKKDLPTRQTSPFAANRAANEIDELREALKTWFSFYNGYDPSFSWWAPEAYKKVDSGLDSYAADIREKKAGIKPGDKTTIVGNPIGRNALMSELQYEMIAYTPEQLLVLAQQEFAWCEAEMKKASRDMGFGDDWHKALEKVKNDYVEPGHQPAVISGLVEEAANFVESHHLLTVPPLARESWRMDMMTPQRQLINPFFTGGEVLSVSFPVDSMTYEQKMMSMRGNNVHFARATVFHELIPGHELQMFYAARYRQWRSVFETPFYVEGWSLYWEMLLWDMNFTHTPEDKVGALFWRMHRAARIMFSLNFHLGRWTPQQCVDFLVEKVGHERENAAAEVRRSFLGQDRPLYQAAYMVGGLQLRELRKELVVSRKMTDLAFHDAVLKENAIPIEMVRAALTNAKLTRDFEPAWRFYGEIGDAQSSK